MKKGKIKILLLALTMILSTFATGMTFEDFEGNDEYSYKVDPPKSTTFYFDEDGDKVDGPTDFWVKFVLSGDELSFTTKNLTLDLLSIKGGPNYRVYSDLGSSGSGLTAPINPNNDEPFGISHYSFELTIEPPPPPPDPEGSIEIKKIVVDEDEEVISSDGTKFYFKVEFKSGENWVELDDSPFEITGNGSKKLSKLPMGEYKITEVDIDSDYELITENGIEVELEEDGDELDAEFTNMKEEETNPPDLGQITVEKIVQNRSGNTMSSSVRFYFVLEMLVEDEWDDIDDGSIVGNGTLIFDGLEDGEYRVREVSIDSDFFLVNSNNQLAEVEEGSSEEVEFINRLRPLPPDDDDDDDDRPRPRPEPEDEPEDEPEVLEITVIEEEPIPEAPPVVEVIEEVVPLATLPATGASDPLLLSGLGTALLGLGLLIKKRR